MKKIKIILVMLLVFTLVIFAFGGCVSTNPNDKGNTEMNIKELKQGDEVSIVGQVASSGLVNGDTLWVQVQQSDGTYVLYHCHLKEDFLESAGSFKLLDVAKVKGLFLSLMDFEQENTMPLVTLYDCELVG